MNFSKRLKDLRERKGLSQEALSEELNIPRSSITHYENSDDRLPRPNRINEIADFFGVTVDYLIGRTDTNVLTKAEERFLDDIDTMSIEELMENHVLTVDGKATTKEELNEALNFIRFRRGQK